MKRQREYTDTITDRRIAQKQRSIDSLYSAVYKLEEAQRNRKKRSIPFDLLRDEIAHTMGFYTRKEELSLYHKLFENSDIMIHVVAQLFRVPLYFIRPTDKTFRPSYANYQALKDVCSLLSTCHYFNDKVGPEVRKYRPQIADLKNCHQCPNSYYNFLTPCNLCKTKYCYQCDVDHYPRSKCGHCSHMNIQCACMQDSKRKNRCNSHVYNDLDIRCYNCKRKLINSSFV